MAYVLGKRSRSRLRGVHADLVLVVKAAIKLTKVDFTVLEGLRSVKRQRELVAKGASWTMNSRHITGHAVDLAPWIGGTVRWDWPPFFVIAEAMREASLEAGIPIQWGAAWGRNLGSYDSAREASDAYVEARRKAGRRTTMDGPHFQLPRRTYPA